MCCGRGAGKASAGGAQTRRYEVAIAGKPVHTADSQAEAKIWIAQNAKGQIATVRAIVAKAV